MTDVESSESCIGCGQPLELYSGQPPKPPCPNCGDIHRLRNVVVNERLVLTDSVKVGRKSVKEQIKKKPLRPIIAMIFFILAVMVWFNDHSLSLLFTIMLSVWGIVLTPFTEKHTYTETEWL
jgi:hypothetical protein